MTHLNGPYKNLKGIVIDFKRKIDTLGSRIHLMPAKIREETRKLKGILGSKQNNHVFGRESR